MWTVQPGFYQNSLIECFEHQGVLVKVHSVGSYPKVQHSDGTQEQDVPRIEILLKSSSRKGTNYFNGVIIKTLLPQRGKELSAWEANGEDKTAPDEYIEKAKGQLNSALQLLNNLGHLFEEGHARIEQGAIYRGPFNTRFEYEQACNELRVETLTDNECLGYGVRYGVFTFPEYEPDFILKMKLAGLRLRGLEGIPSPVLDAPGQTRGPRKAGQLWEPCEQCGVEPSYLPLHKCDACWPH